MKIAVLATRSLRGSGFATRILSMLASYSSLGHEVDLFHYRFPHEEGLPSSSTSQVRNYVPVPLERARVRRHGSLVPPLAWQCASAHPRRLRDTHTYDVVQAETSSTWAAARKVPGRRRIAVFHDDDAVRLRQLGRMAPDVAHRASAAVDAYKYSLWQRTVLREADRIWFVSSLERTRLAKGPLANKSVVVPNGAADDLWLIPLTPPSAPTVLFVGPGFYYPNLQGVDWFVRGVWPGVKRSISTARFRVVGVAWDDLEERPDVSFAGWRGSIAQEYERAAVCIAPLFGGGGTKLKVIEGMAAARPVVTTPTGAEGLPRSDGLRVCGDPDAFAAEVTGFLTDLPLARRAGESNRAAVEHLRWSAVWARAASDLDRLVGVTR